MKIDRLIGILSILLQREKVTAPYLAEKFEVSRRTVQRDIETLCQAGIPIVTSQGVNGGISIMDGYKVDRALLTSADMQAILAGIRSLDSVSGTSYYKQLMEKLSAGNLDVLAGDQNLLIDLSSWYRGMLTPRIELIHGAIRRREKLEFTYFSPKGEQLRRVQPYHLVFQWSSWYVWGWCQDRQDYRMFKLNRMGKLRCTGEYFERRQAPLPDFSSEKVFPANFSVKVLLEPECKWRLVEEFGADSFVEREDGKLLFSFGFSDKENLFSWVMTFGDKAELLEPEEFREELAYVGKCIWERYGSAEKTGDDCGTTEND